MDPSDKCRAWYDARDCGPLAKSHPFQSALCTASVLRTTKSEQILEENLLRFCRTIPKKHKLSLACTTGHQEIVGETNRGSSSSTHHRPCIADGIALADDLYASNEALSKKMIAAQNKEIEKFKSDWVRDMEQRQQPVGVPSEGRTLAEPTTGTTGQIANKFRTAKEQFSAEASIL
jgi:hypothetical protein